MFVIACLLFFVCLEFQIIRFLISTFTPIFFIEISFTPPHFVANKEPGASVKPLRDNLVHPTLAELQIGRESSKRLGNVCHDLLRASVLSHGCMEVRELVSLQLIEKITTKFKVG